jgi:hypothetical protein
MRNPDLYAEVISVNFFDNKISDYPLLIKIAALISLIALTFILIILLIIYFNRVKTAIRKKTEKVAERLIVKELSERFLIYNTISEIPGDELTRAVNKLEELKNTSFVFKKTLVKILVHFKRHINGPIVEIINSAYLRLGLREFSLSKLKSRWWFTRTEGLVELKEMNDINSLPEISRLMKDSNIDVRITAYSALIGLKADNSFSFLSEEVSQLSEWHQIFLLDVIGKVPDLIVPDLGSYLETKNNSIILFCIKVIVHYKQFDAISSMIDVLNHPNEHVRNQLINALGLLNAVEAEKKLIEIYPSEHNKNKSQILIALGNISSGASLDFIREKFLNADHYVLLRSAAGAIVSHPGELKKDAIAKLPNLDDEQKAMLKHFQEPLNIYGHH